MRVAWYARNYTQYKIRIVCCKGEYVDSVKKVMSKM